MYLQHHDALPDLLCEDGLPLDLEPLFVIVASHIVHLQLGVDHTAQVNRTEKRIELNASLRLFRMELGSDLGIPPLIYLETEFIDLGVTFPFRPLIFSFQTLLVSST